MKIKISKAELGKLILEEVANMIEEKKEQIQLDPRFKSSIDKLIEKLDQLDLSIDFLAAIMANLDAVQVGAGQKSKGRYYNPITRGGKK